MSILFPMALYFLPFLLIPLIGRSINNFKRFAIITFLSGSFLGEFAFLILSNRYGSVSIYSDDFWWNLLALYPMAAIPLGFWIVTLATVGYRFAQYICARYTESKMVLYCLGVVLGASVGAIFMRMYVNLAMAANEGRIPTDGLLPYIGAGVFCGAGVGILCVRFSENRDSVSD